MASGTIAAARHYVATLMSILCNVFVNAATGTMMELSVSGLNAFHPPSSVATIKSDICALSGQTGLRRSCGSIPTAIGRLKPLRLFSTLLPRLLKNSGFAPNGPKLGDRKCLSGRRPSIVGHRSTILFLEFCTREFFNSHACLHQLSFPVRRYLSFARRTTGRGMRMRLSLPDFLSIPLIKTKSWLDTIGSDTNSKI